VERHKNKVANAMKCNSSGKGEGGRGEGRKGEIIAEVGIKEIDGRVQLIWGVCKQGRGT